MNIFDRFLDSFSMTDLKKRVWLVIAIGIILCTGTLAGGTYFLTRTYTIAIEGNGKWEASNSPLVEVYLNKREIERLGTPDFINVEFAGSDGARVKAQATVIAIEPEVSAIRIEVKGVPPDVEYGKRFNIRLILVEVPFWKLFFPYSLRGHLDSPPP